MPSSAPDRPPVHRVHNFGAGPAALPLPVLEQAREELLDFRGTGMSILEHSHRGPAYSAVHEETRERLRRLLGLGDDHAILFLGGGARTQFGLVPLNLLPEGGRADYLVTGRWAEMALAEGAKRGDAAAIWSSVDHGHDRTPGPDDYAVREGAAYLHVTTNNTVAGTQLHHVPEPTTPGGEPVPVVADMSSDILSRPLPMERFGVVYAGAQKNLGPAGVTVVVVRRDLLERSPATLPEMLRYSTVAKKDSLLNTPPVFAIYLVGLVAGHLLEHGGVEAAGERNRAKAEALYGAIDGSGGFYRGHAREDSRSLMNVTFRLPDEALEAELVAAAAAEGLVGLKGHRSVGGIRASIYNAVTREAVDALVAFLEEFRRAKG